MIHKLYIEGLKIKYSLVPIDQDSEAIKYSGKDLYTFYIENWFDFKEYFDYEGFSDRSELRIMDDNSNEIFDGGLINIKDQVNDDYFNIEFGNLDGIFIIERFEDFGYRSIGGFDTNDTFNLESLKSNIIHFKGFTKHPDILITDIFHDDTKIDMKKLSEGDLYSRDIGIIRLKNSKITEWIVNLTNAE